MTLKDILNLGEINKMAAAFKAMLLGERIYAGGIRLQRETLAVTGAAATPTYTALQLVYAKTIGTGAPAVKSPLINGGTPSAGQAAPNAGGTSITFNAETTGLGTADVVYLTADPPKDSSGVAAADPSASPVGLG